MSVAPAMPQAFAPLLGAFIVASFAAAGTGFRALFICSTVAAAIGRLAIEPLKCIE